MKKLLSLLLAIVVMLSFAACGKTSNNTDGDTPSDNAQTQAPAGNNQDTTTTSPPDNEITADNWGASERCSAKSDTSENFFINFPKYSGYSEGYGLVAEQLDDTMVIVAGQNEKSPAINFVSELFPAYFDHLQYTLEGIYGFLSNNYTFAVTSDSAKTVGDYDMHTFTGNFEFDDHGEHVKYNFVAYATTLKSNGAYAYWVVYDTSADQSNGALIAEHALNMAKTFRE